MARADRRASRLLYSCGIRDGDRGHPTEAEAGALISGTRMCMSDEGMGPGPDPVAPDLEAVLDPDSLGERTPEIAIAVPPGAHLVEIVGVGLHVRGFMRSMHGGRFSDQVNLSVSALHLYEAGLVDKAGHVHSVLSEDLFITKRQIVLISELRAQETTRHDFLIPKTPREFVAVAPGFVITAQIHLAEQAAADLFFESEEPPFIPLTRVEVRGRLGERWKTRYDFALLNRAQVSAMGLRPMGSVAGRRGQRWDMRMDGPGH
jgi:hypothetical protein